jgi:hypothetical protein
MGNWRGGLLVLLGSGLFLAGLLTTTAPIPAEEPEKLTREQVIDQTMKPFEGTNEKGVDRATLKGKVGEEKGPA